jgi:cytochrome oxidase assembly protein ShyY1
VYRFVLSPRWIGLALFMCLASATMVGLGIWQLHRYHERATVNARIDAAGKRPAQPLQSVLAAPARAAGSVGAPPPAAAAWTMVNVSGEYDASHQILARERVVNDSLGYEVITPLRLADGSALLVDRGWVPFPQTGATALPSVPAAPTGTVTVTGRVHAPESRADSITQVNGAAEVHRIDPAMLAPDLPYPVYGAYVTLEAQTPPAAAGFVAIPPEHQNSAMNAGYVVQWWVLAGLTLFGYGYLAYREAHTRALPPVSPAVPVPV